MDSRSYKYYNLRNFSYKVEISSFISKYSKSMSRIFYGLKGEQDNESDKRISCCSSGATGAVGQQMIQTLENRKFPITQLTLLSSARSAGTKVTM